MTYLQYQKVAKIEQGYHLNAEGGRWGRLVGILNIIKSKDMSFKVESIKL